MFLRIKTATFIILFTALISCSNNFDPNDTKSTWLNGVWYNVLDSAKTKPLNCSAKGDSVFIEIIEKGESGEDSTYLLKGRITKEYTSQQYMKVNCENIPYYLIEDNKAKLVYGSSELLLMFYNENKLHFDGKLNGSTVVIQFDYVK